MEEFIEFSEVKITDERNKKNVRIFIGVKIRPAIDKSGDFYVVSLQDDSVTLYITGETYQQIVAGICNNVNI